MKTDPHLPQMLLPPGHGKLLDMHTALSPAPSVSQRDLDIAVKTRSNLLAWNGQFSPQLVHSLISAYAPAQATVLDPFAGSATVASEAIALGHSFFGFEVNPAAYILGSLYALAQFAPAHREEVLSEADSAIAELLSRRVAPDSLIDTELVRSLVWTRRRSSNLVVASVLMNALRSGESARVEELRRARDRVHELVQRLPRTDRPIGVRLGDARSTGLVDGCCDLVITSPPYINVFNYHQQYRPVVEALGCRPLHVAVSEIGANRKHRQNRFLTVIQYCLDIGCSVAEMFRTCKKGGRVIMIVGRESSVLGVPFRNGDLVVEVVRRAFGIDLALRQERKFTNRFGQLIYEDVLHFEPVPVVYSDIAQGAARAVALESLHSGLNIVNQKSISLLRSACLNAADVKLSPLFHTAEEVIPRALCSRRTH
jgi:DNA methylase